MNTKLISDKALAVIDNYKNFRLGSGVTSIPYYNNRHLKARARLRAQTGKGNPKDIFDEAESVAVLEKFNIQNFDTQSLKKFLVEKNIGIDCSGYAYYILNEESESRGKGQIDNHLSFPLSVGFIGKIRSKLRPVENTGVQTFAHEKNSHTVTVKEAVPGDMITMLGGPDGGERDHILIVHRIEFQNFIPTTIHYTHAIAWPTDGEYGHGVRDGKIEILDPNKSILDQKWTEAERTGEENYTYSRATKSVTEIRRLNWF